MEFAYEHTVPLHLQDYYVQFLTLFFQALPASISENISSTSFDKASGHFVVTYRSEVDRDLVVETEIGRCVDACILEQLSQSESNMSNM